MNEYFDDIKPKPAEEIPHKTDVEKINNGTLKIKMEKKPMGTKNEYGIEETKDVAKFLCRTTNAVLNSLEDDGKITFTDFPKFAGVAMAIFPALSGISEVPKELADLTEDEFNELKELVKEELELDDDVEAVIEKTLVIANEIKLLIDMVKTLRGQDD